MFETSTRSLLRILTDNVNISERGNRSISIISCTSVQSSILQLYSYTTVFLPLAFSSCLFAAPSLVHEMFGVRSPDASQVSVISFPTQNLNLLGRGTFHPWRNYKMRKKSNRSLIKVIIINSHY